jgi:serine/threonine protein kinase
LDKTKVSILKRPNDFVQDDKKFIELADFVEQSNTANGMMSGADSNISGVTSKRCNLDSLSKIANIGKRIGYGSYGTVYDAKVNGYNKNLALKREYYRKANRAEDMRHEQALLTELSQKYQQNPFILMYFGGCDDIKMKDYDEQTPFVNNRGFGVINNIDSEELSTVRPRDDNNIFYVFSERGSMDLEKYMETNSKTISTYEFLNLAL